MINSKDLLAKLLATEDLTVLHANAKTASFNTESRVLTLPIWKDMTNETYDHLTGHEVGHALYTPNDGWGDAVETKTKAYRSFLNVVEDARIEKLIQRKYPGLRRSFVMSYKKMMKDGFFGSDIEQVNAGKLIDRINIHFKCGASAGVEFTKEELVWVKEIETLETWDEVVDLTNRLYASELKKKEEEDAAMEEAMSFDDVESDGDEEESDENISLPSDEKSDDGEESDETETVRDNTPPREEDEDLISDTDEEYYKSIEQNFNEDSNVKVENLIYNNNDVTPLIVPFKNVIADFDEYYKEQTALRQDWRDVTMFRQERLDEVYRNFLTNNKKAINYLVKEFEMKKSASEYVRAAESKTGVLDSVKMHSYKFNDDIFKKVTVVPEGKSHGMIMYLDWSGSMDMDMKATIEQLLNLVHFCRQVNIPFRVYAFTDGWINAEEDEKLPASGKGLIVNDTDANVLAFSKSFRYVEFFNNKMKKAEFVRMSSFLLNYKGNSWGYSEIAPRTYRLYATPLDAAIMGASSLLKKFQKENRVDIVNTIILTDGDSHPIKFRWDGDYRSHNDMHSITETYWNGDGINNIVDPETKMTFRLKKNMRPHDMTEQFLKIYRKKTGSTVIGFRIVPGSVGRLRREIRVDNEQVLAQFAKDVRKNKYACIPGKGYNKYFGILGGKGLETANGSFEVTGNETHAQLRTAFKKASRGKVSSRALLNEFVKEVA